MLTSIWILRSSFLKFSRCEGKIKRAGRWEGERITVENRDAAVPPPAWPTFSSHICALFARLSRRPDAGSFVHQKAPAPGGCLLSFLSRGALALFYTPLHLSWSPSTPPCRRTARLRKRRVSRASWGAFALRLIRLSNRLFFILLGGNFLLKVVF